LSEKQNTQQHEFGLPWINFAPENLIS